MLLRCGIVASVAAVVGGQEYAPCFLSTKCAAWSGTPGAFTDIGADGATTVDWTDGSCLYGHVSVGQYPPSQPQSLLPPPFQDGLTSQQWLYLSSAPNTYTPATYATSTAQLATACTFEASCNVTAHECRCITEAEANGGAEASEKITRMKKLKYRFRVAGSVFMGLYGLMCLAFTSAYVKIAMCGAFSSDCGKGCNDSSDSCSETCSSCCGLFLIVGVAFLAMGHINTDRYELAAYTAACGAKLDSSGVYTAPLAVWTPPAPAICGGCSNSTSGACRVSDSIAAGDDNGRVCVPMTSANTCPDGFAGCFDLSENAHNSTTPESRGEPGYDPALLARAEADLKNEKGKGVMEGCFWWQVAGAVLLCVIAIFYDCMKVGALQTESWENWHRFWYIFGVLTPAFVVFSGGANVIRHAKESAFHDGGANSTNVADNSSTIGGIDSNPSDKEVAVVRIAVAVVLCVVFIHQLFRPLAESFFRCVRYAPNKWNERKRKQELAILLLAQEAEFEETHSLVATAMSGDKYRLEKGWVAAGADIHAAFSKVHPTLGPADSFDLFVSATNVLLPRPRGNPAKVQGRTMPPINDGSTSTMEKFRALATAKSNSGANAEAMILDLSTGSPQKRKAEIQLTILFNASGVPATMMKTTAMVVLPPPQQQRQLIKRVLWGAPAAPPAAVVESAHHPVVEGGGGSSMLQLDGSTGDAEALEGPQRTNSSTSFV